MLNDSCFSCLNVSLKTSTCEEFYLSECGGEEDANLEVLAEEPEPVLLRGTLLQTHSSDRELDVSM